MYKKIVVCCSHAVTGGPEVLHQLVHALRSYGHDARICYYPFDVPFQCPEAYKRYNAPADTFCDEDGTLTVIPEAATWIRKKIRKARCAIWWLSVDNYFQRRGESALSDFLAPWKSLARGRRAALSDLRDCLHLAQSHYAASFLQRLNIRSELLTDYLAAEHLTDLSELRDRRNIAVYNPKKGATRTQKLISNHPDVEFVPIRNMTAAQVADLLRSAKIYVDVGNHPGKDRLPREAAMAGCCVITGMRGAAGNPRDIPIPPDFKIDDSSSVYVKQFRSAAEHVFGDFAEHSARFDGYRRSILREPHLFLQQVRSIFGVVGHRSQ